MVLVRVGLERAADPDPPAPGSTLVIDGWFVVPLSMPSSLGSDPGIAMSMPSSPFEWIPLPSTVFCELIPRTPWMPLNAMRFPSPASSPPMTLLSLFWM